MQRIAVARNGLRDWARSCARWWKKYCSGVRWIERCVRLCFHSPQVLTILPLVLRLGFSGIYCFRLCGAVWVLIDPAAAALWSEWVGLYFGVIRIWTPYTHPSHICLYSANYRSGGCVMELARAWYLMSPLFMSPLRRSIALWLLGVRSTTFCFVVESGWSWCGCGKNTASVSSYRRKSSKVCVRCWYRSLWHGGALWILCCQTALVCLNWHECLGTLSIYSLLQRILIFSLFGLDVSCVVSLEFSASVRIVVKPCVDWIW